VNLTTIDGVNWAGVAHYFPAKAVSRHAWQISATALVRPSGEGKMKQEIAALGYAQAA